MIFIYLEKPASSSGDFMKLLSMRCLISVCSISMFCGTAGFAQQLQRLTATSPTVLVGQVATLTLETRKIGGDRVFWCGVNVAFGDGSQQAIRIGQNGDADQRLQIQKTYDRPGTYTVSVTPEFISRGLRSAVPCDGSVNTVSISVSDPSADNQRREAERLRLENERLRNEQSLRLQRERQDAVNRDAELRRREVEIELQRREADLRRREEMLKSQPPQPPVVPNAPQQKKSPVEQQKSKADSLL